MNTLTATATMLLYSDPHSSGSNSGNAFNLSRKKQRQSRVALGVRYTWLEFYLAGAALVPLGQARCVT